MTMRWKINLKSAHVEAIAQGISETLNCFDRRISGQKNDTCINESFDSIGSGQTEPPGDDGAPVVAHQKHLLHLEGVQQRHQVSHDVEDRVAAGRRWSIAVPVPAEVGDDGAIPLRGEVEHLVAPRVPQLWEAVEEEYGRRPFAQLRHVHVDAVDLQFLVHDLIHF